MTRLGAWLRTPDGRWLIAVFALALIVRLIVVASVTPNPRDGRFDDSVFYDSSARHLAAGDGYVFDPNIWVTHDGKPVFAGETELTPTALWPPGWPLTLAAIYRLSGDSVEVARFANAIFGALTVGLVYLIALRLFVRRDGPGQRHARARDPRAARDPYEGDSLLPAIAAGFALAVMPAHVLFTSILLAETYFGFLMTAALAICVYFVLGQPERDTQAQAQISWWARNAWHSRPRLWAVCLLGALVAFAGLTRGEFTIFGGIIALLLIYEYRARVIAPLAALFLGAVLVIAPWAVRNAITMGEPIAGTTGAGRTMYQGHNPIADGGPSLIPVGQIEIPFVLAGLPRDEVEVRSNRAASKAAREWAWDHKLKELDLVGRRMWQLFRSDEAGVSWLQSNKPWFSPENRDRLITASTAYFWGLAAIAIASAPVWWRGRDARRLVVFAVIPYYMLIFGVLFVGDPRYHYAMYIPMAIFGGAGIAAVARITAAQWRETFGGRTLGAVFRTNGTPER